MRTCLKCLPGPPKPKLHAAVVSGPSLKLGSQNHNNKMTLKILDQIFFAARVTCAF